MVARFFMLKNFKTPTKFIFFLFFLLFFLLINKTYSSDQVKIGAYINDVQYLELDSHSYSLDFYLWFKWTNPKINPSESFEFMNAFELWGHSLTRNTESPVQLATGEYYQVVRVQGRFSHKFQLQNYPFDRQFLVIEFEDNEKQIADLKYVIDEVTPISINPSMSLPGFEIESPQMTISQKTHPTDFGEGEKNQKQSTYARVKIQLPIVRPVLTYLFKTILPILCVVFSTCLMFLFYPTFVDARVGIGITSLLTIVALQITLNYDLPEIDYLILMDKIYLVTYLFIVMSLSVIVYASWIVAKNNHSLDQLVFEKLVKIDRLSLIALMIFYLICVSCLILFAISKR